MTEKPKTPDVQEVCLHLIKTIALLSAIGFLVLMCLDAQARSSQTPKPSNKEKLRQEEQARHDRYVLQEDHDRFLSFDADISKTWRFWCHELIDWSQEQNEISLSLLSPKVLSLPKQEAGRAISLLLQVLNVPLDRGITLPPMPLPFSTQPARLTFLKLLSNIKSPLCAPDLTMGNGSVMFQASEIWKDPEYTKPLKADVQGTLREWQSIVLKWADAFEAFPQQFPKDHYLNGYALLYGAILRMNWDDNLEKVGERFSTIEAKYADNSMVRLMASWYHTLLQIYREGDTATKLLSTFATENLAMQECHVVEVARAMLQSPKKTQSVVFKCFSSPLRSPERLGGFEILPSKLK